METLLVLLSSLVLAASLVVLLLLRHGKDEEDATKTTTSRRRLPLPPGPPAVVFLAKFVALRRSIFDLGPLLRDLHARHGPVISVRLARTLVFVADRRLAHRALVQGGATFADRPPPVEPGLMFNGGRDISSAPYGAYWRAVRRNLAGEALQPSRVGMFAPARRWVCDDLVAKIVTSSSGSIGGEEEGKKEVTLRPLLRRAMFELLVYMCFGARLAQEELDEIERLQHRLLLSVTSFPVFAFFPAVTKRLFRKRWAELVAVRRRQDDLFLPLIHNHRNSNRRSSSDAGDSAPPPPCYAESLLKLRVGDDAPLTDAEMVSLCSEFLNGGTDTTVTLVEWIMAELVNHPDVQAKLRHELLLQDEADSNSDKNESDKEEKKRTPSLLKAVVMEGLRLHPPGHFVLPHGVTGGDAELAGHAVPRGAEVNFLVAEIGRDATAWTAPLEFRPERFLDGGEGRDVDITGSREIRMMPFGAGRRMCPGYALGMRHAEYFVARLVRDLHWQPPRNLHAVDMAEALDFTVVMKHPLRARVVVPPPLRE